MTIHIEQNIMVPMRDGVKLATDVYRPAEEGQWPVLLTRVPYNKDQRMEGYDQDKRVFLELNWDLSRVVEAGYVVVAQDTRGRYASEGQFSPGLHEELDGADTIAWAASQPWSTGKVGMFGVSYQGLTQWQVATKQPPALQAIAPSQSPFPWYPYQGGAFMLSTIQGVSLLAFGMGELERKVSQGLAKPEELQERWQVLSDIISIHKHLPLVDGPLMPEDDAYFDWLAHPSYDDSYWRAYGPKDPYELINIPALIIGGWHDYFLRQDLANYRAMKQRGGSAQARQQSRLIIGPWSHGVFQDGFPDRSYGTQAAFDLTNVQIRWYDHWLKGIENGIEQEKPVHIFVMGIDQWRAEEDWPLPDTQYRPYYLHSEGHANTATGDGLLSTTLADAEPEDVYLYDPLNPVPSIGAKIFTFDENSISLDQRPIETREDVLCYTTPPLEAPVEVTGPVELVLYVSSSALDTDFTGKLVDVYPDGRAEILTDGILRTRARYRESLVEPTLLEPGQIYELHIDLEATSNVFRAGHRIRLEVSSSNFPRFDRNTNTGGTIATDREQDCIRAINRVYHDAAHPSHLILPVIER